MRVIYLASGRAKLKHDNVYYNDLYEKSDFMCDMMDVDLNVFDVVLASPPCNFYSKARGNKPPSKYAESTKHLLPDIIKKCLSLGKPFIIENVRNKPLFSKLGYFDFPCFVYFLGRHTYWTNIMINFSNIPQTFDFSYGGRKLKPYIQGGTT